LVDLVIGERGRDGIGDAALATAFATTVALWAS